MAIFDPSPQYPHPLTDHQKFVTGDYVGDPYDCAKFGANAHTLEDDITIRQREVKNFTKLPTNDVVTAFIIIH